MGEENTMKANFVLRFDRFEFFDSNWYLAIFSLRLGVTYEKGVTLGNVTMSHRTRERPAECLASLSHSTMIGLPRAALEN
ncbi:hypothetical protein EVAR_890_1 [Eumeta japonica]|uniref:Uncharacterized protein n=1 Tax=Eumeta variegata TaxID=151549 RepID=A0A4C1SGQ6_EUMVA|nr:hypothetical protein EVAR_890_1 [Eumeta japonica]